MGDKIKPWHAKKPKQFGKKVSPLRAGNDKRIVPLRVDSSHVSPLRVNDDYEEHDGFDRWSR
jgi:hypothetical protein